MVRQFVLQLATQFYPLEMYNWQMPVSISQFAHIFLTYQTFVPNLYLLLRVARIAFQLAPRKNACVTEH